MGGSIWGPGAGWLGGHLLTDCNPGVPGSGVPLMGLCRENRQVIFCFKCFAGSFRAAAAVWQLGRITQRN